MPNYVKAQGVTGLQKRLIDEAAEAMRANKKRLTDLAKETGLGKAYLSLLLHGKRPGTMATWDLIFRTCSSWPMPGGRHALVTRSSAPPITVADVDDSAPAPVQFVGLDGSMFNVSGPPPGWEDDSRAGRASPPDPPVVAGDAAVAAAAHEVSKQQSSFRPQRPKGNR